MSKEDDIWSRWFTKRSWWPFTRRWVAEDIEDVFSEMEEFMASRFKELSENAPKNLVREHTLPEGKTVKEWGPFVYGYTMTVGEDGRPKVREFGNIKPRTGFQRPELDVTEEREPLTDVIDVNGNIKAIIELPGVSKDDIKLKGTKKTLTVSVSTADRKYYKKLDLPVEVNHETTKSKYKNGVLEVTINKTKTEEREEDLEIE